MTDEPIELVNEFKSVYDANILSESKDFVSVKIFFKDYNNDWHMTDIHIRKSTIKKL